MSGLSDDEYRAKRKERDASEVGCAVEPRCRAVGDGVDEWKIGDFPFYWVQLADFRAEKPEPAESDWAELREAQTMTMSKLPNTGEAVIIDLGEDKDIHPRNKQEVGLVTARTRRPGKSLCVCTYRSLGKVNRTEESIFDERQLKLPTTTIRNPQHGARRRQLEFPISERVDTIGTFPEERSHRWSPISRFCACARRSRRV